MNPLKSYPILASLLRPFRGSLQGEEAKALK